MSSNDYAIHVQGLSKCYQIYATPRDRLKQFVIPFIKSKLRQPARPYYTEFWALNPMDFRIAKGETVGILGKNGSGKSTLLQIICGTLSPTSGTVDVNGRVAALLELGSGFNMEFTGKENVYMNAAVLGLSKSEIDERYDAIIDFADIGHFIDQSVKTYSSGMIVRLAFAVAINVTPDILIVDEALAVGDAAFQQKCFKRIDEMQSAGCSILLVTHDLSSVVQFCDRAMIISHGTLVDEGDAKTIVGKFKRLMTAQSVIAAPADPCHEPVTHAGNLHRNYEISPNHTHYGEEQVSIIDWGILNDDGQPIAAIDNEETVEVVMTLHFKTACAAPIIGYFLTDLKGREFAGTNTLFEKFDLPSCNAGDIISVKFKQKFSLSAGTYALNIGCSEYARDELIVHHRLYDITLINITSRKQFVGFCDLNSAISSEVIARGNHP
ncbi:ABC transporter ATP-binding protein [Pseudomonas sp. TE3610]